ncbi:MAG: response regulator [Pirellulales bacterium]|nr:response regulator [Pirellulales bacterium]
MIPTIMLIEDNFNNISLLEDIFKFDNIPAKLSVMQDGEEALRCAARLQPALILMDLRLPGIDGLETTQILKSCSLTKDIPVWAITAYAMPGDEERARAAGCCEYFTKPTNTRDFADRLRKFLNELAAKEQDYAPAENLNR